MVSQKFTKHIKGSKFQFYETPESINFYSNKSQITESEKLHIDIGFHLRRTWKPDASILNKLIDSLPNSVDKFEHSEFVIVLNKKEYEKYKELFVDGKYKNIPVKVYDNSPEKLIYIKEKSKSKYH